MTLHAHDQFAAAAACYRRAHALDLTRFDYLYYLGVALSDSGKRIEAIEPLERALALDPKSIPARFKLGEALLAAGRTKEARRAFQAVLERDPGVAAAHYGLGRTLEGEEAAAAFGKALEIFPRYGAAQFALAAAYRKAGRGAEADKTLAGYEQNRTSVPPLDDPLIDAVLALNAGVTGLLRQAQLLEQRGRLEEAAAICERAAEQEPKNDQAWVNLISLYGRLGDAQKLERSYRKAIEAAPNRADAYYNYGVFCFQSGRLADARKAFEKTIALDPRNAEALHNLGAVVERSGALEQAASLYRKALSVKPEYRLAHFHLGRIYANQRRYKEAIAELEKSLEPKDEQTPAFLYALAAAHARAGHRKQSLELMHKARDEAAGLGQAALAQSIERDLRSLGESR